MEFVETPNFTKRITTLLSDDEYRELQKMLIAFPDKGVILQKGGGIRKLRWRTRSGGKSGGLRIIYYWYVSDEQIFLLLAYKKNEQKNVTPRQLQLIRQRLEKGKQ